MAIILDHYDPEYPVMFDVDETLVSLNSEGLAIHERHVQSIKGHWARGHRVIVWSAGGEKWARFIVNYLELGDYVHEIMSKPKWIYDDQPPENWCQRIYHYKEGFNNGRSYGSYEEDTRVRETSSSVHTTTSRSDNYLYTIFTK